MIVGNIFKGIKRIVEFKIISKEDKREIVEIQNNLICRLSAAQEEAKENIINAIKDIDRILN